MEIWVNSATKTEDYAWRTIAGCSPTNSSVSTTKGFDQWKFEDGVPWYGLVFQEGIATLYFGNLETGREDTRGRPIFVHAVMQATEDNECRKLRESLASLLVREKELLPRWAEYLQGVFDDDEVEAFPVAELPEPADMTIDSVGRFAYPREDVVGRKSVARVILFDGCTQPFAVGVTGRSGAGIFERVCRSDPKWQVAFFSGMCTSKMQLQPKKAAGSDFPQSPFPFNRTGAKIAAVAAVAMIAWAILPGGSKKGLEPSEKIGEESQKTQLSTNLSQKAVKSCETNSAACLSNSVMTGKSK